MNNRFVLFMWDFDDKRGGVDDIVGVYETLKDAIKGVDEWSATYVYILDMQTGTVANSWDNFTKWEPVAPPPNYG